MLAGLIFATEDADDRPGTLAATLPFGGLSLIEFQARLLVAAGASQIILVVARMTPELLGAINRIGRRGASVDAVRTASEVVAKLHPLARVLVVADGLVTNAEAIALLTAEAGDTLLVVDDRGMDTGFERVGALTAWAGLALLDPKRIEEVAAMPRDYDFQSTLLRVAAQDGAEHVRLQSGMLAGAHGIERDSRALAIRGNATLAGLIPKPIRWADRFVLAPLTRLSLPPLMARAVSTIAVSGSATMLALVGFGCFYAGWPATGLGLTIAAISGQSMGAALAWVRDETGQARLLQGGVLALAAISALWLARATYGATGAATGWAVALTTIAAAGLVERASDARLQRRWWASPVAYPVLMLPVVIAGQPLAALCIAAIYAFVTLGAAIEAFREKP